jgi:uncharacterized membrane protein YfcA
MERLETVLLETVLVALASFATALLTFFSGFGLGTLLLPVFALFYPLPVAVAATAMVHFANNLFKGVLMLRQCDWKVVAAFGPLAMVGAWAGASLLTQLNPAAVKPVIGGLIVLFALLEWQPQWVQFSPRWIPVGGALSGFFGGLSGHQGALRTAFLVRLGLNKNAFIATNVALALLVDVTRLSVYKLEGLPPVVWAGIGAALVGSILGRRWLPKVSMAGVHRLIDALLMVYGLGLLAGWL